MRSYLSTSSDVTLQEISFPIDNIHLKYYELTRKRNDAEIAVRQFEHLLIILPGFGISSKLYLETMQAVITDSSIILVGMDYRGHGDNPTGNVRLSVQLLADDLNTFIQYLKNVRYTQINGFKDDFKLSLLGSSMGVNVIWHYISSYGEKDIYRHIFIDQPVSLLGSSNPDSQYPKNWRIHSIVDLTLISYLVLLKNWILVPILRLLRPKVFTIEMIDYFAASSSYGLSCILYDTSTRDNTERIKLISRPCIAYCGDASFVEPAIAGWIARRVRGPCRVLRYPKPYGTHFPFFTFMAANDGEVGQERFCEDVVDFLSVEEGLLRVEWIAYITQDESQMNQKKRII
jgi:pimeloyl-ACP methyl ester carboxylesterase